MIRQLVAVLIATLFVACCGNPACDAKCDETCNQRATSDRSSYYRTLHCVQCLEACSHE